MRELQDDGLQESAEAVMTISEMEPAEFAERVILAGGAVKVAKSLGVGKDWVYRRLSGQTPIRPRDEWMIERLGDTMEPQNE